MDVVAQNEVLKTLRDVCTTEMIALPDQKSLINYLMAVLDGERVTARVKQFMCMIEQLTTEYMLGAFLCTKKTVGYKKRLERTDQDTPPETEERKGQSSKGKRQVDRETQKAFS